MTVINEKFYNSIEGHSETGSKCILRGIGSQKMDGQLIPNVAITLGSYTILATVCVAPIEELCLIGLDVLKPLGAVIDLNQTD